MGSVFVEDVVEVDEQRSEIFDLGLALLKSAEVGRARTWRRVYIVWRGGHDADQLEEIHQDGLGHLLELKRTVKVLAILLLGGSRRKSLNLALFQRRKFVVKLDKR